MVVELELASSSSSSTSLWLCSQLVEHSVCSYYQFWVSLLIFVVAVVDDFEYFARLLVETRRF